MRTLLLFPELFARKGGVQTCLQVYLQALGETAESADGELELVVLNDPPGAATRLKGPGTSRIARTTFCQGERILMMRAAWAARKRVNRIICGHVSLAPVAWLLKLFRPELSYFVIAHGIEAWTCHSPLRRMALAKAERLFCVSSYTRNRLAAATGLDRHRFVVLPNALSPDFGRIWKTPHDFPLNPGGKIILTVARLDPCERAKGVEFLLEAMPEICRIVPDTVLVVVGSGRDLPRFRERVAALNLERQVFFRGFVSEEELPAYYDAAELFALPSEKEGFGLVFLEAMHFGKPCLGAACGGIPDVITPNSGALVPPGDLPALVSEAVRLLQNPPPPDGVRADAERFSYPRFRERLAIALGDPLAMAR